MPKQTNKKLELKQRRNIRLWNIENNLNEYMI